MTDLDFKHVYLIFFLLISKYVMPNCMVMLVTSDSRCWDSEDDTSHDSIGPRIKVIVRKLFAKLRVRNISKLFLSVSP